MTPDDAREVLLQHADSMLPNAELAVEVTVTGEIERSTSRIWFADVRYNSTTLPVVVKWRCDDDPDPAVRPPRLIPVPPSAETTRCEGEALRAIDQLVMSTGDARFRAVRVHLCNPDGQLLIMDRAPGDELRKLLLRLWRSKDSGLRGAFLHHVEAAGAWLRQVHDNLNLLPSQTILETGSDIRDQAYEWMDLISPRESFWPSQFRNRIAHAANDLEPTPIAVLHGDFWPGNVLIDEGRTCVIDAFACVRGPVWLDIAYFLLHLRAVNQQVHAQGLAWPEDLLAVAEEQFLRGYFNTGEVDRQTRWLYTALALLAKWAGNVHTLNQTRGGKRILKRFQLKWRRRYYRRLLRVWESGEELVWR